MATTRGKVRMLSVHLADNEWGNETMRKVATVELMSRRNLDAVTVYEHAGWYMVYAMIGGELKVVGSANGDGCYSPSVQQWWAERNQMKWEYLPTERREVAEAVSV